MGLSQLPPEEISRRIKGGRELRGISQSDLAALMAEDGLGRSDLGRIERCNPDVPLRLAHQESILRNLRLPERWLTEPDMDIVVGYQDTESLLNEILAAVRERDIKHEIQVAFDDYATRLGRESGKLPLRSKRNQGRRSLEPPAAA